MKIIGEVFYNLGVILLFINVVLFTRSYFKFKNDKAITYFIIYLFITLCVLSTSIIIIDIFKKRNNLFLSHFYFIFQFIFLSLFYKELFTKRQGVWVNITFLIVGTILIIQYSINPSLFFKFNLLEIFITSFPLVIYSIIHLYNSLSSPGKYMYINAGVLIYLAASTLIFILGNLINVVDRPLQTNIWFINKILYVGYLILILIEWRSLLKTKN